MTKKTDRQQKIDLDQQSKPDCTILTDLVMQITTGFEVVKKIRSL